MLYLNEHDDGDEQMDSYKFPALGKASSHAPVFLIHCTVKQGTWEGGA